MELHRVINRDWQFTDASTWLLAEIATITSHLRFLNVASGWDAEANGPVPEYFLPVTYGPPRETTDVEQSEAENDEIARQIAAEFISMQQQLPRGGVSA